MGKRGRPQLLKDASFIGIRVERHEREMLEALAALNGHSLTVEMRLAVRRHLRVALDDHADDQRATAPRTTNAPPSVPADCGAFARTHSKENERAPED